MQVIDLLTSNYGLNATAIAIGIVWAVQLLKNKTLTDATAGLLVGVGTNSLVVAIEAVREVVTTSPRCEACLVVPEMKLVVLLGAAGFSWIGITELVKGIRHI